MRPHKLARLSQWYDRPNPYITHPISSDPIILVLFLTNVAMFCLLLWQRSKVSVRPSVSLSVTNKLGDSYICYQWLIKKLTSSTFRKTKVGHRGHHYVPLFWGEKLPAKNFKFQVPTFFQFVKKPCMLSTQLIVDAINSGTPFPKILK